MPATAGRVRMPANNRVHSSAALQTHGIWESAIGYAYASFQGLLSLAWIIGSNADEGRGACTKCGRVGHLAYQCRNFLSIKEDKEKGSDAIQAAVMSGLEKIKGNGKRTVNESSDESEDEDEDSESSDSDYDSEIERAIALKYGKKVDSKSKSSRKKKDDDSDGDEREKRGMSKKRSVTRKKEKKRRKEESSDDDMDCESHRRKSRKEKRRAIGIWMISTEDSVRRHKRKSKRRSDSDS